MTSLIFAPDLDFPSEGNGTTEFNSQAKMLKNLKGGTIVPFDNETTDMNARGKQVIAALKAQPDHSLDWLAFCCHGWKNGIQAGFDTRGGVKGITPDVLAIEIARVAKTGQLFVIPLYCCSTAEDPVNGFAAVLEAKLRAHGVNAVVFAHTTVGHTTRNPFVRVFGNGDWLIAPTDPHWHKWVVKMHDLSNDLDFRYPWMTRDQLIAEL